MSSLGVRHESAFSIDKLWPQIRKKIEMIGGRSQRSSRPCIILGYTILLEKFDKERNEKKSTHWLHLAYLGNKFLNRLSHI